MKRLAHFRRCLVVLMICRCLRYPTIQRHVLYFKVQVEGVVVSYRQAIGRAIGYEIVCRRVAPAVRGLASFTGFANTGALQRAR